MLIESFANKSVIYLVVLAISLVLIFWSRHQPFPLISKRLAYISFGYLSLLLISDTAPRPMEIDTILLTLLLFSGLGLWIGMYHLLKTRRDVIIAPMFGFLFCLSSTGLIVLLWDQLDQLEHWVGFLTLGALYSGQTWLVFRGLLIGRLPLAWSQAGYIALSRGHLFGPHGAIECFERAWDAEEEHLNPMAYFALEQIHQSLGNQTDAQKWSDLLELSGGIAAIDGHWVEAVESSIENITTGMR
jgi:hypothetical protein